MQVIAINLFMKAQPMASDTEDLVLSISADTRQIMNAIKRLEKSVGASAGQIEKTFSGIGKGIDKSIDTSIQKRINEITGIGVKATKEWTGALTDQSREMDRMRARFNPIFATVTRYKATVAEIQTAHRLGAISADEMTNAIQRERQAALASISALKQRNAVLADRPNAGGSNFNTANIAAQFQDIGVTAAMGMSPIQIALQQGTQLSAVLNQMGNARGAIAGLGAAFMQIVNPVSLATIGVVGLTAAALQYFSTFMSGSDETEEALKAQAELIQRVADKWGDALPSIKAYADEQKRIAEEADKSKATQAFVADIWEPAKAAIEGTRLSLADLILSLQQAGAERDGIAELQRSFEGLRGKVVENKGSAEDLQRVSDALTSLYKTTGIPIVSDLAAEFSNLADQISMASAKAALALSEDAFSKLNQVGGTITNAKGEISDLGRLDPLGSFDANRDQTNRANATKSQYQLEQERLARSARSGGISEAEKQKKAIDDVISSLQFEQAQLGRTAVEQRVYNEMKRAGVDLNSEAGQQIAGLVAKIESERAAIEASTKAREAQAAAINNLFEMGADALVSIAEGSTKAEDAIKRLAVQLALAAAQAALLGSGPLAGLFGGGGLFGGAATSAFVPGILSGARVGLFAKGTNSAPGGLAIVGEEGPELVNLPRGAQVIPNDITRGILNGPRVPSVRQVANQNGDSVKVDVGVTVDDSGNLQAYVRNVSRETTTSGIREYDRGSMGRTVSNIAEARRRNINI